MQATAILKFIRLSPQKGRLIADQIRGLPVERALEILQFSTRKAAKPVKTIGVRVHLMFESFNDQQNTVLVARQPGDERRGLYFQAGDLKEQVLRF